MTEINVYEIVRRLVGPIEPIGETRTDEARFENLKVMIDLMDKIHTDIDDVLYRHKDRHEASIKKACQYIDNYLTSIGIIEE